MKRTILFSLLCLMASTVTFAAPPVVYKFDAPLVKTGENMGSRTISIPKADATHNGYLSSTDWTTFNNNSGGGGGAWGDITGTLSAQTDLQAALDAKQSSLSFTLPLSNTASTIACRVSTGSVSGCLSSTDWTTFNAKQSALSFSLPLVNTAGTISCGNASASLAGCLSSSDWSTFNSKQDALTVRSITASTYTVDASGHDDILLLDATSNTINLTLPAVASSSGRILYVKDKKGKAATNNITITGASSDQIDGSHTQVMTVNYRSFMLVCNGSIWSIL